MYEMVAAASLHAALTYRRFRRRAAPRAGEACNNELCTTNLTSRHETMIPNGKTHKEVEMYFLLNLKCKYFGAFPKKKELELELSLLPAALPLTQRCVSLPPPPRFSQTQSPSTRNPWT